MVQFHFTYGIETLTALLGLGAFARLSPSPNQFQRIVSDPDSNEQAMKTNQLVGAVVSDVTKCVDGACKMFEEALRGRLGTVVNQTIDEIIVRSIEGQLLRLTNVRDIRPADLRNSVLETWQGVEKVRIGTPAQGAPTFKSAEEVEALILEAKENLAPSGLENNKTAIVEYIKHHYPSIRCGSVKQLNRLIEKFELKDRGLF